MNYIPTIEFFLDSGAFSAWAKGEQINLNEYIQFCQEHLDILDLIANLDVIPGSPGETPTEQEKEEAARRSYENYHTMLDAGLPADRLIPCFHHGERWEWLEKYKEETDYIALGGIAKIQTTKRHAWLDDCFRRVIDKNGMPQYKIHGFGVTGFTTMLRYPWYSVDSTSWVNISRFGSIFVPVRDEGDYRYDIPPIKVTISEKSPTTTIQDQHYDTMTPSAQRAICQYVELKGFSIQQAREDYIVRDQLNIIYYRDFEDRQPTWPWAWKPTGVRGFF